MTPQTEAHINRRLPNWAIRNLSPAQRIELRKLVEETVEQMVKDSNEYLSRVSASGHAWELVAVFYRKILELDDHRG